LPVPPLTTLAAMKEGLIHLSMDYTQSKKTQLLDGMVTDSTMSLH